MQYPTKQILELTSHWKRENMAKLFQAYTGNDDKYSGSTKDNFERKLMMFLERCEHADIHHFDRHRAFFIMLAGQARQYYFDALKTNNLSLVELETAFKVRFQTSEQTGACYVNGNLFN